MKAQERQNEPQLGYGNIYTPHAGEMIIHIHRASGLANRTFILGPRGVQLVRRIASRYSILLGTIAVASWAFFAVQAARVPALSRTITRMQADSARLDTLEHTLVQLNQRYDQLQRIMAATPTSPAPTTTLVPPPAHAQH